jgi:hypothetical protein
MEIRHIQRYFSTRKEAETFQASLNLKYDKVTLEMFPQFGAGHYSWLVWED